MQRRMPVVRRYVAGEAPVPGNIRWRKTSSRHGDKLRIAPASGEISVRIRSNVDLLGAIKRPFSRGIRFHRAIAIVTAQGITETTHCRYHNPKSSWTLNMSSSVASTEFKMPSCIEKHECDVKEISGSDETIDNSIVVFFFFLLHRRSFFRFRNDRKNSVCEIFHTVS